MSVKTQAALIRNLLYIAEIAHDGKISRVAEKNGIKASNLSKMIKDTELAANSKLFLRTPNGMIPTQTTLDIVAQTERICRLVNILNQKYFTAKNISDTIKIYISDGLKLNDSEEIYPHTVRVQNKNEADVIISTSKPKNASTLICTENKIGHLVSQTIWVCAKNFPQAVDFATSVISKFHDR